MLRIPSFSALTSPQNYNIAGQIVAIFAGLCLAWAIVVLLLWAGGIFLTLLLVIGLAAVVFRLDSQRKRRDTWILTGCCGNCGYDLRRLPSPICPECGHDTGPEEPTWRKRQREHQLQFGHVLAGLPGTAPTPARTDLTPPTRVR